MKRRASSPLAQLYSTSTMEHHHFDQCLMILSSHGNQILANVSPDEYSRVVKVLEEAILSTDLAVYFRKRTAFLTLARCGSYNWSFGEHRELLRGMLMTVCDLAAITKPWDVEKRVAELVSSEFFEQGDIERRTLNITPIVSLKFFTITVSEITFRSLRILLSFQPLDGQGCGFWIPQILNMEKSFPLFP